jgi:hypothetical protein
MTVGRIKNLESFLKSKSQRPAQFKVFILATLIVGSVCSCGDFDSNDLSGSDSGSVEQREIFYEIGDIGPAGGVVFKVAGKRVFEAASKSGRNERWCLGEGSSLSLAIGKEYSTLHLNSIGGGAMATNIVRNAIEEERQDPRWDEPFGKDYLARDCTDSLGPKRNPFFWIQYHPINRTHGWYVPTKTELREIISYEIVREKLGIGYEIGDEEWPDGCKYLTSTLEPYGLIHLDTYGQAWDAGIVVGPTCVLFVHVGE